MALGTGTGRVGVLLLQCDWAIVTVERPLREQQGLHCRSGTTHSHHTLNRGSSCPIFTHPTLTMRGTKADSSKYGKSAWNPTSVWIPIMECTWTWDSLLKLLAPLSSSLLPTNYKPHGRDKRACTVCEAKFLQRSSRQGFFLHAHTQQNLSVLGEEAQCTHSCPYHWA